MDLHQVVTYSYAFVNVNGVLIKENSKTVPNGKAAVHFLEELLQIQDKISDYISLEKKMEKLTAEQHRQINEAKNCSHCHLPLHGKMLETSSISFLPK